MPANFPAKDEVSAATEGREASCSALRRTRIAAVMARRRVVAQVVSRRSQLCCVPSPHVTNKGANQRSKDEKRQHEHGAMNELKLTVNTAAPWGDEAAAGPRAERGRPTWPMEKEHVTRFY